MWNKAKDAELMTIKREEFLETGFKLFSTKSIESVTLSEVAKEAGYGMATLYRYFDKKPGFVVAVATWKLNQFLESYKKRMPKKQEDLNSENLFVFYLDSYIELYKKGKDLLRFLQYFSIYIKSNDFGPDIVKPYVELMNIIDGRYELLYKRAMKDHLMRTDVPVDEIFGTISNVMLAAATRYATGYVLKPESAKVAVRRLEILKEAFMNLYLTKYQK